jgi:hypothetical protein
VIRPPYEWRRSETVKPSARGPYLWDRQAGQQWFLRAARDLGVRCFQAVVYSPPGWMTKNGHAQPDRASGTTNLREDAYGAFAAYLADILERLRDVDGIELESLSPLNEPNWSWDRANQESNRYANDEIARIVRLIATELGSRGIGTRVVVPEAGELMALLDDGLYREYWSGLTSRYAGAGNERAYGGKYREYIRDTLGDAGLRDLVHNTISAHSYWSDYDDGRGDDRLVRLRRLVRRNLDLVSPSAAYRQTEYCILGERRPGRDMGMQTALAVATVMHDDLTLLDAEEWSWWLAVSPYDWKDGLVCTDYRRPGDTESILLPKLFWAFGNFSRFVRPGFVRVDVEAIGTPSDMLVSSYRDPGDGHVAIVVVNGSAKRVVVVPEIRGTSEPRSWRVYVTCKGAGMDLALVMQAAAGAAVEVPPLSVTTLVSS